MGEPGPSPLQLPVVAEKYHFPTTHSEAELILCRNKAWYAPHYEVSITPYTNASALGRVSPMSYQVQAGNPTAMPPKSMTTNIMEPNEPAPLAPPSADSEGQPVSAGTLRD